MSTGQVEETERVASNQETEDITLLDGEEVLQNVKPSLVNWTGLLLVTGVIVVLGLGVLLGGEVGLGFLLLLIGGLLVLYVRLARKRSRYIVTNQRVKKRVGLARRSTGETRIAKIRGLSTEQGFLERIVGKGSVLIDSGAAGGKLGIRGVADHDQLANTIREQQRRMEER